MTKKLFDLDSYITCCTAKVVSCEPAKKNGIEGYAVQLDESCFFPEGGGQPSDTGIITAANGSVIYWYNHGY